MENNDKIIERSKIRSEIWRNWVTSISIAIAGFWAAYTFWALKEVHRVESKQVALQFDMEVNQIKVDAPNKFGVEVIVLIENTGIRPVDIDLSGKEVFALSRLGDKESEDPREVKNVYLTKPYNRITFDALRTITSVTVYPGVIEKITYFVVVDYPGLYYSSFISEIPEDALKLMTKREVGDVNELTSHPSAWGIQKYFRVKENTAINSDK